MKDLYKTLGVSPTSSLSDVKNKLDGITDRSLHDDIFSVLLNSKRKYIYDRNRNFCEKIGLLRRNLCLSNTSHWDHLNYKDFIYPSEKDYSLLRQLKLFNASQQSPNSSKVVKFWGIILNSVRIGIVALVLLFFVYVLFFESKNNNNESSKAKQSYELGDRNVNLTPRKTPQTGIIDKNFKKGLAPFVIKTSQGVDYYVKIENIVSRRLILVAYIRGGKTLNTTLPIGSYTLRYASGKIWYGQAFRFGPETVYSKADHVFDCTKDSNSVSGYTVELISRVGGNLRTSGISSEEF